jgi:TetR/AcrR family transcriptional regulator, lmrAB and yxaGH operons repressor
MNLFNTRVTMTSTRDQIIETTCELLEAQGYHGTGLNQILRESGAPKGSLYYYFPEGKDELTAEAIERSGRLVEERVRTYLAQHKDAASAVRSLVEVIAYHVEASGFRSGGPLMTVAMETATTNERLNLACREAYRHIQQAFEDKLKASGFSEERAAHLATFINASIEGGIILSRTHHSNAPLHQVARLLDELLRAK